MNKYYELWLVDNSILGYIISRQKTKAWNVHDDAPRCERTFTRNCPVICSYLDGSCARKITDKQAIQASKDFYTKVEGKVWGEE